MIRIPEATKALRAVAAVAFALQFVALDAAVRGLRGYAEAPRALWALVASAGLCGAVLLIEHRAVRTPYIC